MYPEMYPAALDATVVAPAEPRPVMDRLVSPNAFDGRGPVPDKVTAAARHIAEGWWHQVVAVLMNMAAIEGFDLLEAVVEEHFRWVQTDTNHDPLSAPLLGEPKP